MHKPWDMVYVIASHTISKSHYSCQQIFTDGFIKQYAPTGFERENKTQNRSVCVCVRFQFLYSFTYATGLVGSNLKNNFIATSLVGRRYGNYLCMAWHWWSGFQRCMLRRLSVACMLLQLGDATTRGIRRFAQMNEWNWEIQGDYDHKKAR